MKIIRKEEATYRIGQLFVDGRGDHYRLERINKDGTLHFQHRWGEQWHSYGDIDLKRVHVRGEYMPVDHFEDMEAAYNEVQAHPEAFAVDEVEADDDTTALAAPASYNTIINVQQVLAAKRRKIELAQAFIEHKKREMEHMISGLANQIARLQKIVDAFDLYLGIHEDLIVLRSGQPCEDPITLRQMILYMDEEYGDPRPNKKTGQPGLDFQSIEDFDQWLLKSNHLDQVLPERKGIVALKVSRQNRFYDESPFFNAQANAENKMTYLLIRNGENVYRVFTSIVFGNRLYPTQAEMEKVIEALQDEDTHSWDREKIQDKEYIYRRNALIIQGLLDRTQIFQPLAHECSLFKPDSYPGCFNFVRDDEMTLDDGHLPWKEWKNQINAKIGLGSRIVFVHPGSLGDGRYYSGKDFSDRFVIYSPNDHYPHLPDAGVYQIERVVNEKLHYHSSKPEDLLYFKYNPGDEVLFGSNWEYDPHPRKNRVTFRVLRDDDFIFNYDQMELADIEYYLSNRRDREDFLRYFTLLWELRDQLQAERAKEVDFVKLVAHRLEVDEAQVWEAVDWWKFKNMWKRAITKDDALALRMIEKRLSRQQEKLT